MRLKADVNFLGCSANETCFTYIGGSLRRSNFLMSMNHSHQAPISHVRVIGLKMSHTNSCLTLR